MDEIQIAMVCHEVNRAYCAALGDDSQPPWELAPEWQKKSAITGVRAILADDTITPQQSHEGWLKEKERDGWTYGVTKDPATKQHPCCVPYHMLPQEQRAKDYIFGSVVRSIRAVSAGRLGDGLVGDRAQ